MFNSEIKSDTLTIAVANLGQEKEDPYSAKVLSKSFTLPRDMGLHPATVWAAGKFLSSPRASKISKQWLGCDRSSEQQDVIYQEGLVKSTSP